LNADSEIILNEINFSIKNGLLILSDEGMISKPRIWENTINYNNKSGIKCIGNNNKAVIKSNLINSNRERGILLWD